MLHPQIVDFSMKKGNKEKETLRAVPFYDVMLLVGPKVKGLRKTNPVET